MAADSRIRGAAAYSRVTNEEFVLRASHKCFAPSALRGLERRLQTRVKGERQWILTVTKKRALQRRRRTQCSSACD